MRYVSVVLAQTRWQAAYGDLSSAIDRGGIAEETKHSVDNSIGIVQLEVLVNGSQERLVRVF